MALPQKAIEQLSREPAKTPGWSSRALMFTGTIFFLSLAIWLGMRFGYQPLLERQDAELQSTIDQFKKKVSPERQTELIGYYSQLYNLKTLLKQNKQVSLVFNWLEAHTITRIWYSKFSLDSGKNQIILTANARSLNDVTAQLAAFENLPEITAVNFTGTSAPRDGVYSFGVTISFDPKLVTTGTQ